MDFEKKIRELQAQLRDHEDVKENMMTLEEERRVEISKLEDTRQQAISQSAELESQLQDLQIKYSEIATEYY